MKEIKDLKKSIFPNGQEKDLISLYTHAFISILWLPTGFNKKSLEKNE